MCRTDQRHPTAFATIQDETETTVVVEENDADTIDAGNVESGWKRLTFEMDLPFEPVDFLTVVATALAEADIAVFVLFSYSTSPRPQWNNTSATPAGTPPSAAGR